MKRYLLLIMALAVMSAGATERLFINDFNLSGGETKAISLMMDNDVTYSAVQFDIKLPSGVTLSNIEKGTRCRNHSVTTNTLADGSVRVWISSMSSRTISGKSGELLKLTIKTNASFSGSHAILLKNCIGAHESDTSSGERVEMVGTTCYINGGGLMGDMDLSGVVDIEDVNAAINVALKLYSIHDYPGYGDMDGNGYIDIEDINAIINKALKL